jgi:hypothetical protein
MLPGGGERLCDDDSFDAVKLKEACPFEKRARFRAGWVTIFFFSETVHISVSLRRSLIALANQNVKVVAAFIPCRPFK